MNKLVLILLCLSVFFGLFSVWSAINPSFFTMGKFVETEEDRELLLKGIGIAILAAIGCVLLSFYLVKWAESHE